MSAGMTGTEQEVFEAAVRYFRGRANEDEAGYLCEQIWHALDAVLEEQRDG